MTQATQRYKRSFTGSVGSGMKSVFGGEGRRYYILEYKTSSKYHKAGESQKIIVDQIELGRDGKCQIRFDESFETVSRRHAAIVRDGDSWKLVQLSQTNSTYLNGRKIENEWYLQNGDEIQLSGNGPKLGFLAPQGDKGLVKTLGMTARLNLFRKQALRPYKQAITALSCVFLLCASIGGYMLHEQNKMIKTQAVIIDLGQKNIDDLINENSKNTGLIKKQDSILIAQSDMIKKLNRDVVIANKKITDAEKKVTNASSDIDMSSYHPHVYLIKLLKTTINGQVYNDIARNFGTGFMLDDGKFVTARHVSHSLYYSNNYYFDRNGRLRFDEDDKEIVYIELFCNSLSMTGNKVVYYFEAISTTSKFTFTSEEFIHDGSKDMIYTLPEDFTVKSKVKNYTIPAGSQIRVGQTGSYDWSYIQTQSKTGLKANRSISENLIQGTNLYVLGYPSGRGEGNPILSTAICSQNGLDRENGNTIMASNNNTEGGNSGGPIFIKGESGYEVVAIVSGRNNQKGRFVPIRVIP